MSVLIQSGTEEGRYTLELPCGQIDNDEPLAGAQRELQEETGLVAEGWTELSILDTSAGISNIVAHVYLAQGLRDTGENKQDEDGIVGVQKISFDECLEMIKRGELRDSQSVAAILLAELHLKRS